MRRRVWIGLGLAMTLAGAGSLSGCSSEPLGKGEETGRLTLPLSTQGPSGAEYRLRDAVFEITSEYYYDDYYGGGGASDGGHTYVVSSEDDPAAQSISVDVERGYYYVRLKPGWRMEKIVDGEAVAVEAQLLSSATQWAYVSPRSSSWVEYQFGIGDRALWFNGDLNIGVQVYEDPDDVYGGDAGAGGTGGWAGAPNGAGGA